MTRDLIATMDGACSATFATKDDKEEAREVLEDSMYIKDIGEWGAFLIFFNFPCSSDVSDLRSVELDCEITPCLENNQDLNIYNS